MTSTRLTRAVVELAALERNWRRLQGAHAAGRLMTVLKANAYGHGLVPVARFLQGLGQALFAVALLDEALELRQAGITGRILVLGAPEPGSLPLYRRHDVEATVPSLPHLREAVAAQGSPPVHLKCDTGMGRIGLREAERAEALALLRAAEHLDVRGVYSHLAEAERLHSPFCETQRAAYEGWCAAVREARPGRPFERHLANSAGLLRDARYHYDYARVGFALWAPPAFDPPEAAPALNGALEQPLTLRTRVTVVKTAAEGDTLGYGRTYRCAAGETIATLPLGYGDGLFRALGNRGAVLLRGRRRSIVGNVSMDQLTVSLGTVSLDTEAPDSAPCAVGDEAIVLGGGPGGIAVAELAAWAGALDYEVFTHLGTRIPREYVYDGVPVPEP